jgi:hypothetical protein
MCQSSLEGYVLMPRSLTAENGAKALMIGEFFQHSFIPNPSYCGCGKCDFCHDFPDTPETIESKIPVSWNLIKKIYAFAVKHLGSEVPA